MFNFLFKNALTKKSKLILTSITIILTCIVGLLSINVSQQVNDGIIELSDGYDVVIGPSGSEMQLAYNALFFSGDPLGTIDYSIYEELSNDHRIAAAIPFAMADTYGAYKIVGTVPEFLASYDYDGSMFTKECESVIGYNVAKNAGLKIGDTFYSTHGAMGAQHAEPITVVGILDKTNTNYDNVIFAEINTVWHLHGAGSHTSDVDHVDDEHDEHEENDGVHEEESEHHNHGLTAILLRTKSIKNQAEITGQYSKINGLQAITPTIVLRESLKSVDMSKQIVFALTTIIFVMSVLLLFIITLLTAQDLKNDIRLMRYLGISSMKIKTIFLLQSAIVSVFSIAIGFALSHLSLGYINNISTGYGIVINPARIYSNEYCVLGIMFIVTLLPIIIYMSKFFKKDITKI